MARVSEEFMHWTVESEALGACDEAIMWANSQPDFATAWQTCERGDWMLWIAAKDKSLTRQLRGCGVTLGLSGR